MGERALRSDARRNRDAIIAAARLVFEAGEQVRFDDFASRAGVGVGTLYRHFPTRSALAEAVYGEEVAALCDLAQHSHRPGGERLDAFLLGFVDYIVEHVALARALASAVDEATKTEGGAKVERTLVDLMAAAAADGAIHDDIPPGSVLIALHSMGSTIDRPHWAAEARAGAQLIIRGLKRH